MAIIRFVTAVKNSALDTIKTAIDAGAGAGTIKIYTGTQPTTAADAVTTQTLLGTLTFSDPCGTSAAGVLTMSAITQDSSADATGTATWARIADSTGSTVCDVDVTATGGGGYVQMASTSITAGGPIAFNSFTITLP